MRTIRVASAALAIAAPVRAQTKKPPVPSGVASGLSRTSPKANRTSPKAAKEDVNRRNVDGSTPLQWAVYNGDVAEVRRLLRAGADVSVANNYRPRPTIPA